MSTGLQIEDANDLVQEVMALLLRKLPAFEYDRTRSFRSWLKTVTINKLRERLRRRQLPMSEATESVLAQIEDPKSESFWEVEYRRQVVARAIALMEKDFKPPTWQACRRYLFEGASPDALAAEYQISVWTIYSAKSRLLKRLREELDGLLD